MASTGTTQRASPAPPDPTDKAAAKVRRMFDGIAPRYDLLNHVLSLNLDRGWRRAAARAVAAEPGEVLLDLCAGTGDLSLLLAETYPSCRVLSGDFSHAMLRRAADKVTRRGLDDRCHAVEADGLRLPLGDASIDAVTVAFGVRNFENLEDGLREIRRVLRPGGKLVVLEFSRPTSGWLGRAYAAYLGRLVPRLGDGVSGRAGPYGYLARTIVSFPDQATLAGTLRQCGFGACGWESLTGGIVAIHTAYR